MTEQNINNSQETKINQGESKGGDASRSKTSLFIALAIIPFVLFATFGNYVDDGILGMIFSIYNLFFRVVLGLGGIYMLHELVNFIYPKSERKDEYWITMWIFGLVILIPYCLILLGDIISPEVLTQSKGLTLILILMIGGIVASMIFGFDLTNTLLIGITSFMFYGFISTFSTFTISGSWETIFLFILVIVSSDTFAYFGGKQFGSRKAFPNISPNKTVEGLIIGFVSAILIGFVFVVLIMGVLGHLMSGLIAGTLFDGNMVAFLLLIPLAALFAPLGDLYFSKIKRTYEKKDFSNLLPGHGGILDRIDSHIFAMTVVGLATILLAA